MANNSIVKNSFILVIRTVITSFFGLITVPFALAALGQTSFGLYAVLGSIVSISSLFSGALTVITYRFITIETGKGVKGDVNKIFNICFILHLSFSIFVLILSLVLGSFYIKNYLNLGSVNISDVLFVFYVSTFSAMCSIIFTPFQGVLFANEEFSFLSISAIIQSGLNFIIAMIVNYYFINKLVVYSILMSINTILPYIAHVIFVKLKYPDFVRFSLKFDKVRFFEIFNFGKWSVFGTLSSYSEIYFPQVLINYFFGPQLNSAFGIASQINNVIKSIALSINNATIPQIMKSFSNGNTRRTFRLTIFSSKFVYFALFLITFPILLNTKYVLEIWLNDVPDFTVIFLQILLINSLISFSIAGFPSMIQAHGSIKNYMLISSLLTLSGFPISFFFYYLKYNPQVLLYTYTLICIIQSLLVPFLARKVIYFRIKALFSSLFKRIFLVTIPMIPLFFIINMFEEGFLRFIMFSVVSAIFFLILVIALGISKHERVHFQRYFHNKLKIKSLS